MAAAMAASPTRGSPPDRSPSIVQNLEVEDIMKAYRLLLKVSVDQVRIHRNAFTSKKMYTGELGLDVNTASKSGVLKANPAGKSETEILRKNIYYLARKTMDVVTIVIQMTQRGLLDLDQKDLILDHDNNLVSGVELFRFIIKQEPGMFDKIQNIFRKFNNAHIADLLAANAAHVAAGPSKSFDFSYQNKPSARPRSSSAADLKQKKPSAPWICASCTYENPPGNGKICKICYKTQGSPYSVVKTQSAGVVKADNEFSYSPGNLKSCPTCTLDNPAGAASCSACGNDMNDLVFKEVDFTLPTIKIKPLQYSGFSTEEEEDVDFA